MRKERTVAERLEFVEGFKYLGVATIKTNTGKVNQNLKNFSDIQFVNEETKAARSLRVRNSEVDEFLTILKVEYKKLTHI